jgi:hypothetical protein
MTCGSAHAVRIAVEASVMPASSDISRPFTRLFAPTVMPASAIIVPANFAVAPMVVAPLTAQKTLQASAPPTSFTSAEAPMDSAPPIWKMNTASSSPSASNVIVPPAVKPIAVVVP